MKCYIGFAVPEFSTLGAVKSRMQPKNFVTGHE